MFGERPDDSLVEAAPDGPLAGRDISSTGEGVFGNAEPSHDLDLARVFGATTNRRHALQSLAAGTVTGLLAAPSTLAKKRRKRQHKRRRDTRPVMLERKDNNSAALKVMTRNLYLGADLAPLFAAPDRTRFLAAVAQVFAMVQSTDFPERAKALAAEIDETGPHIVGLQEVTLWRSQTPADFSPVPNAQHIEYDFLATLLAELAARGKQYEAVAIVENTDAEAPRGAPGNFQDIRLTDHDVLLARTDLPEHVFSFTNVQSSNFAARLTLPSAVGPIPVRRGWVAVDVTLKGQTARVVNTHLEPLDSDIQLAQATELLARPLGTSLPAVLLGDLNSAADGGEAAGESNTPTYATMIEAGFVDAWTATRGDSPGFTWGQAEDLRNPVSTLTRRIDFILTRGGITASSANRVGEEPEDRTPSGLWPSDHAGVWAVLHL
jgi:endonuclease/exonuclease/phosphatase family metal-dependent hydrolase